MEVYISHCLFPKFGSNQGYWFKLLKKPHFNATYLNFLSKFYLYSLKTPCQFQSKNFITSFILAEKEISYCTCIIVPFSSAPHLNTISIIVRLTAVEISKRYGLSIGVDIRSCQKMSKVYSKQGFGQKIALLVSVLFNR